jgi:microcystin-dependent protein
MDPFIGEIRIFGGNFAPRGWALCNGAVLQVRLYPALFSLLGSRYGGNGQTTFGLPNFQGNVPIGAGAGPGLTPRSLGDVGGATSVQLDANQLAIHGHALNADEPSGNASVPNPNYPAASKKDRQTGKYNDTPYSPTTDGSQMARSMVLPVGGSNGSALPHNNVQPYQAMNFIIALEGIFPAPPAR